MVGDPISDLIVRLTNSARVGKTATTVPYSKLKHAILETLSRHGWVGGVSTSKNGAGQELGVELLYNESGAPRIHEMARISKPSRRLYLGVSDIRPVKRGQGALVLSTPSGVLTDTEAKKENVGGEPLFTIW